MLYSSRNQTAFPQCPAFVIERQEFQENVQNNPVLIGKVNDFKKKKKKESMTQLMLDSSALLNYGAAQSDVLDLLEHLTREFIHTIHQKRRVYTRQGNVREFYFFSRSGNCQGISYCIREKWNFVKMSGNFTFQSWSERKDEIFFFKIQM